MPVKTRISETSGIYFNTFTCLDWLPLFEIADAFSSVYNWFDVLKSNGHYIVGYTIMPNHPHAVIAFVNHGKQINKIVANGKRFMAYDIIARLKELKNDEVLKTLQQARSQDEIKDGKLHKVFETSFDWKHCDSDKLILQKLDYLHNNPCKGKWMLANSPVDYKHSSAKYYFIGEQGFYSVTHYKEIEDIDLHSLR